MHCFLCKKNNFELVYKLNNKQIIKCQNDGLFFAQIIKKPKKVYGEKYFAKNPHPSSSNEKYFLAKITTIKKLSKKTDPTILDVGCGWGDFLQVLKKYNIKHKGIDTSEEAINICRSKKLSVDKTTLQALSNREKNTYDAVTFFQVIEHLKNPLPVLQAAKKILKKNGIILLTTPNNNSPLRKFFGKNWSVFNEDSHFVFYNQNNLFKTLKNAGFNNIKIKNDSTRFLTLQYIMSRLNLGFGHWDLGFIPLSIPTDPFGDLEAVAIPTKN